ncbi:MAG: hypothetical protein M1503_06670 [Thaumarchaeota archaeon]|nr:hypothetical protein [Nitrososphaerota archaeon]MCL5317925.1 hypothetical protein [Nitrososphaerota archaeon]
MNKIVLTKGHLASMLDSCIKDIQDNGGSKAQNLGNFLKSLGEATQNDVFISIAFPIGQLGYCFSWFKTAPIMTMLTPDVKRKYEKLLGSASTESVDALTKLKAELCERKSERPIEIIKIISTIDKNWMALSNEIGTLAGFQPQAQE